MRRVTRNFLLAMGVLAVLLLALGALPGYLTSGDPYYMTATPVGEAGNATAANATAGTATPARTATAASARAVDAANLSERRYPYTTEALENATADSAGRSSAYYRGPVGIKGAFTHSPFDERDALVQRYSGAADGDTVRVRSDGTVYRLAVTQQA
ncbi:hypothetical protein [Haloarcula sediminis]|uniref:hypothetical protein n=1 Tax=Haloarcula sediminis TaxID=3111777 RepID=UPI002D7A1B44|nr:hypothetical protein [Haloarcula sp. CK38]